MKIHNPSKVDIAEIPIINGEPVTLGAGQSMECTEAMAKWMKETWGFLEIIQDKVEEPKMTELVPDEPEAVQPMARVIEEPVVEEPKKVKKEKKGKA